jgi:hypothetical protein
MSSFRYFMWRFQRMLQSLAAESAGRLLEPIDPHLKPDAFLVGFRVDEDAEGREPICVSPEDCPFHPDLFKSISERAKQIASEDPRSRLRCTTLRNYDLFEKWALLDGGRRAVEEVLAEQDTASVFFASQPTPVNGYVIVVVVQLDRACFDAHNRLTRSFVQKVQTRYPFGRSLIDSTGESYLGALVEKLQQDDIVLTRDLSSIHRAAAERLMRAPAWAGGDRLGLGDIHDICNTLSLQNDEGIESERRLVFVGREHPAIRIDLTLRTPVSVRAFGPVRKLLQMGSEKFFLFCDSQEVYGLGTVGAYDPARVDLFVVRFVKRFTWELLHADHLMMHCREGRPSSSRRPRPLCPFVRHWNGSSQVRRRNTSPPLADAIIALPHGAMLVVTPSAAQKAVRLAKQATVIEPIPLTRELIDQVTKLDGAILIDLEGTCRSIGVMLDGRACDKCTAGRDARYNAGVRYAYQENDRVVLVKSDDGMVNVLPELT